ncbi:MAG: hypothetical protein NVS4B7_19000 [Ktedonobacteraceae bacterium]
MEGADTDEMLRGDEMKPNEVLIWVQIVNGLVATLAIIAAGWWFIWRRSLAGTLQITLTLIDVGLVKNTQIAVVRVQLKNVGLTKIEKDYCASVVEATSLWPDLEPLSIVPKERLNYSQGRRIFSSLTEIEPNEETFEDVVIILNGSTFFTIGVFFSKKGTSEAWQAIAVFNAAANAKGLSAVNLAEQPMEQE